MCTYRMEFPRSASPGTALLSFETVEGSRPGFFFLVYRHKMARLLTWDLCLFAACLIALGIRVRGLRLG